MRPEVQNVEPHGAELALVDELVHQRDGFIRVLFPSAAFQLVGYLQDRHAPFDGGSQDVAQPREIPIDACEKGEVLGIHLLARSIPPACRRQTSHSDAVQRLTPARGSPRRTSSMISAR